MSSTRLLEIAEEAKRDLGLRAQEDAARLIAQRQEGVAMSKYMGTPELEALVEAWYADESDLRDEPEITYDPDYPSIALYLDIQNSEGEWEQLENELWRDEVREWHESDSMERIVEGMWRE